jgi:hypothetical protein
VIRPAKAPSAFTPRRASLLAASLAALSLCLAFAAFAPKADAVPKGVSGFFPRGAGAGSEGGQLSTPRGIAVNRTGAGGAGIGDIYVVDGANNRVQQFTAGGAFVRAFGQDVAIGGSSGFEICTVPANCKAGASGPAAGPGANGGQLLSPQGIAIDQASGDVYVTEATNIRVSAFDASGNFLRAWGKDVSTSDASGLHEVCTSAADCKIGASGGASARGGEFNSTFAGGIAVAPTGAPNAGNVLVTDPANRRVQEFAPSGAFVRAFGMDVVVPGGSGEMVAPDVNERQGVSLSAQLGLTVDGGTFTLTFGAGGVGVGTTAAIDWNASAAQVDAALEAITNIGAGNVEVTGAGSPWTVEFTGALAGTNVNEMTGNGAGLLAFGFPGFGAVTVTTPQQGSAGGPGFEVCAIAAECKPGLAGAATPGSFANNEPKRVAVSSTGAIYTVESSANFRVQRFTPQAGPPPLLPATFASAILTGTSAATAPTDVAIGPSDRVIVAKGYTAGTGTPPATVAERRVLELSSAGSLLDTNLANSAQLPSVNGLAANSTSGAIYVTASAPVPVGDRVFALGVVTPPSGSLGVSETGVHSAAVAGVVNPNGPDTPIGVETFYRIEVSKDGIAWKPIAPYANVGDGTANVGVSATLKELEAATNYRVRLSLGKQFSPTVTTTPELFTTAASAPDIEAAYATVGAGAVELSASLNPNNSPTTYRFEYGTSDAYGASVPVPDASAGAAGTPKTVTEVLSGLAPDTDYHFRLVATNANGTATSADRTFTTREAFDGFPERAYEMATLLDKGGYEVNPSGSGQQGGGQRSVVSPNGAAATFASDGPMAGQPYGGSGGTSAKEMTYLARRGTDDWNTTWLLPRADNPRRLLTGNPDVAAIARDDLSLSVVQALGSPLNDDPAAPFGGFYLHDKLDGSIEVVYAAPTDLDDKDLTELRAYTPDLEHLIFESPTVLTDDPGVPAAGFKVYDYTDGHFELVSVLDDGTPLSDSSAGLAGRTGSTRGSTPATSSAITPDGNHVFFSTHTPQSATQSPTPSAQTQIYRRDNGEETVHVSPSKLTPVDPLGPKAKVFQSATPDQSASGPAAVFFTSSEQLTNDANTGPTRTGNELYRYDVNTDTLTAISAESNDANGAQVQGMLGHTDDGKWVYYAALGQVAAGKGVAGQRNLYLWHDDGTADGETRFIATLSAADARNWAPNGGDAYGFSGSAPDGTSLQARTSRISADGRTLLIQSSLELTEDESGGLTQLYLFEADGNDGLGRLDCVSCRPSGEPPVAPTTVIGAPLFTPTMSRVLTEDGDVFFETRDPVLSADVNATLDVYHWRNGKVELISTGKSETDTYYMGTNPSATDVYFATHEQLVGRDNDVYRDLYDAKVGGGLISQFPPPPGVPCVAEACKPPPSAQGAADTPASSGAGGGNVAEKLAKPRCAKRKVRRKGKCVRTKRPARQQKKTQRHDRRGTK